MAAAAVPSVMQGVLAEDDKCVVKEVDVPVVGPGQVLLKVAATAVNRADTMQRKGRVPPPPGTTPVLGLEAAGAIVAYGEGAQRMEELPVGTDVMALLVGGGHGEYVVCDERHMMPIPKGMDVTTAAGIPETWLTAYQLLHTIAGVGAGDRVLVLAAGSGVGTAAIQLAVAAGAVPLAVAGSPAKLARAAELGAVAGFNYKEGSYAEAVAAATDGHGVDIILDCVGASLWAANAASIAVEGRWVLFGLLGGAAPEGPVLAQLMRKRIRLQATTLRARSDDYKAELVAGLTPLLSNFAEGTFTVVVDRVLAGLAAVQEAHDVMEANGNTGKLIVTL